MDIDIVVLWVDGSDPDWLIEKSKYDHKPADDSNSIIRYRDWGLMQYWFRSVESFMPWIRKIHFVTWGHIPPFLNIDNPKLHIVRHEDYIPSQWLPTFSAHPIEMNMHRIPGLAEHFIYFNDDMFLLRPMKKTDFFRNGLPCTQATEIPIGFRGKTQVWNHAAANDLGLINEHFNKRLSIKKNVSKYVNLQYHWYDNVRTIAMEILFPDRFCGFKNFHCPAAYRKEIFEEIWNEYKEVLENTSSHKFRNCEDVNQWLALWWQISSGKFAPRKMESVVMAVDDDTIDRLCNVIETQKYDMVCISDSSPDCNYEKLANRLSYSFEKILAEKSSFELK